MTSAFANFSDARWKYHYKGFTSIVNQTIEIAKMHYTMFGNFQIQIEDQQISQFYDSKHQIEFGSLDKSYDASALWLHKFFSGEIDCTYSAHTEANFQDLSLKHTILHSILSLKKEFTSMLEKAHVNMNLEKMVGVQIRGTDKSSEIQRLSEIEALRRVDKFASSVSGVEKIYVATDDLDYLKAFIDYFGEDTVQYQECIRSRGTMSVHHSTADRREVNKQVMIDVYTLSKIPHFLYTFSNVSYLALIEGSGYHTNIQCIQ